MELLVAVPSPSEGGKHEHCRRPHSRNASAGARGAYWGALPLSPVGAMEEPLPAA